MLIVKMTTSIPIVRSRGVSAIAQNLSWRSWSDGNRIRNVRAATLAAEGPADPNFNSPWLVLCGTADQVSWQCCNKLRENKVVTYFAIALSRHAIMLLLFG